MNRIYGQIFYILLCFSAYDQGIYFLSSSQSTYTYVLLFSFAVITSFLCSLMPHSLVLKILSMVFFHSMIYYEFITNQHFNSDHIWLVSSILMCFYSHKKSHYSSFNQSIISVAQVMLLTHYFSSGLWKARSMEWFSFSYVRDAIFDHYAYAVGEGQKIPFFVQTLIPEHDVILVVGYILVLLFQITSFVPVLKKEYRLTGG